MRQDRNLTGILRLVGGVALVGLIGGTSLAATGGRPVQTETVIIPTEQAEDRPSGDLQGPAAEETAAPSTGVAEPADIEIPIVETDVSTLPLPVRRLREQIIEAAATGDPAMLQPIIDANGEPPMFSFGDVPNPIEYLKSLSGDPEGREILAIVIEVFEAGFVHVDVGTPDEMYVWPYFARYPVEALTPRQMVELFKLVYAGDYEDMKAYGHYTSYRAGIAPDGTWRYFLAGD